MFANWIIVFFQLFIYTIIFSHPEMWQRSTVNLAQQTAPVYFGPERYLPMCAVNETVNIVEPVCLLDEIERNEMGASVDFMFYVVFLKISAIILTLLIIGLDSKEKTRLAYLQESDSGLETVPETLDTSTVELEKIDAGHVLSEDSAETIAQRDDSTIHTVGDTIAEGDVLQASADLPAPSKSVEGLSPFMRTDYALPIQPWMRDDYDPALVYDGETDSLVARAEL